MKYMLCKNEVVEYSEWRKVFDAHAEAHRESGLELLHLLRDLDNPNVVVFLFRVDDMAKARAFIGAPNAETAAERSGVVGKTEIQFLSD